MNSDTLKGKWKQIKGELKIQWARLTDNDRARFDGNVDKLVGKVQELYGEARETVLVRVNKLVERVRHEGDRLGDKIRNARKSA